MQKLAEVCIKRPVFATMLIMAFVVVGAASWFKLGVDRFPAVETDFIFKPSSARYAMLMVLDTLVTELALLQKPRSQETLRRVKYVLDEYRGGGAREPLGD